MRTAIRVLILVFAALLAFRPGGVVAGLSFEEFVTGQPGGLFLAPAHEDPGAYDLDHVRALPPMTPGQRTAFDTKMEVYWHADCSCYRFLKEGHVRELYGEPSTDYQRWLIIRAMGFGWVEPIPAVN